MDKEFIIVPKQDNRWKTLSVRIKIELLEQLEQLAAESNRSKNELINMLLTEALKLVVVKEKDSSESKTELPMPF